MTEESAEMEASVDESKLAASTSSSTMAAPDIYSPAGKKIIKKAHYRFEVKNAAISMKAIESAVQKFGAYIETSKIELENPILEHKITIRVLNDSFADLLTEIDAQATFVNFRNITTDDVSKDFVDLESRLNTKREIERRYADILRNKAGTIEELLHAEEKIGELHEEIEATISRMNYLKDQATFSTIDLEFYQKVTQQITVADEGESLRSRALEALATGWTGVTNIGVALLYLWPLHVIVLIAYFIIRQRKLHRKIKSV